MYLARLLRCPSPRIKFFSQILLLSVIVVANITAQAEQFYAVSGSAYNPKTGKLVYRELITKIDDNNKVHVTYAKPDGIEFAHKVLDYSTEVFQPGVIFTDIRDDETVSAVFDGGRLLLTHKKEGDSQTKTLYETSKLVIDTGIDAVIQQQWTKLLSGKKINIDLANPRFVEVEKLVIKQIEPSESPLSYKGAQASWKYFVIEPAGKFSSIFSDPMYYAYEPEGKFLMRYQGRSNIDNDKGEMWDVRIEYEYW